MLLTKRFIACIILIFAIVFVTGCSDVAERKVSSPYALKVDDQLIQLQDWDDKLDLAKILGEPLSEETETLKNADTMTGSYLKKLTYKGLYMELFSPKGNGKTFWIMTIKATEQPFATPEGITINSTVAEMKKAYPAIRINDGEVPNNATYRLSDEEGYRNLEFKVTDGEVKEILLFFLIP